MTLDAQLKKLQSIRDEYTRMLGMDKKMGRRAQEQKEAFQEFAKKYHTLYGNYPSFSLDIIDGALQNFLVRLSS